MTAPLPRIWVLVPWCLRSQRSRDGGIDIGAAYDDYMGLIREPDDWGLLLDHDAAFTTRSWYRVVERAVASRPDAGMFVAKTNRLRPRRSGWQMHGDPNCHDMVELHRVGMELEDRYGSQVRDVTTDEIRKSRRPASGFFMCIQKRTWDEMGGAPSGFRGVDYQIHQRIEALGKRIYLLEGVLMYHWWTGRYIPPFGSQDDAEEEDDAGSD